MTDRSKLLALAEALQTADGPSLKMDRDIGLALFSGTICREDARITVWDGNGWTQMTVRPYTASIEAAVSLVPDDWNWDVGDHTRRGPIGIVENGQSAFLGFGTRPNPDRRWFEVRAATPAISLCAAALRAQAEALS